jgi:hypothetical protein
MTPWLAVFGVGALLGGLIGGRELASFQREAAADIASRLSGEGKEVSVSLDFNLFEAPFGKFTSATLSARQFSVDGLPLFTEPWRSKSGSLGCLRIRLRDFTLRGLRVSELSADIRGCKFDLGLAKSEKKVRLSWSGKGPGFVRVTPAALEAYILNKYREIKRVKVWFRSRRLFVEGFGDFGFFSADFFVIADLVPREGTKLFLEKAIVFLDGVRVRDGSEQALLDALNPVIDEDEDLRLYGALQMERVSIGGEYLEISGTATIPSLPSPSSVRHLR